MSTDRNTRLTKKLVRQSEKKLLLVLISTVIIIVIIIKFGIPIILFLSGSHTSSDTISQKTNSSPIYIAPPILNSYATATNSAQIKLTGNASQHESINLYVNNQNVSTQPTENDGSFSFDNVSLTSGDNTIQAKAKQNGKESDFSNSINISYINKAPSLTVSSPSDGQTFQKDNTVVVSGKTDANATVTVNSFRAIVDDAGNFSYTLQAQNGDNQIKIIATDNAGNKTEKNLKITFNP